MSAKPLTPKPRALEVESLEHLDRLIAEGATSMAGWHLQSLDLTHHDLSGLDPQGSMLLGCDVTQHQEKWLRSGGALIFPALPGIPFDAYRGTLYTGAELYEGLGDYEETLDAQAYAWSSEAGRGLDATLASALHDHAIGDALEDALASPAFAGRPLVGIMGGHALKRGSNAFAEAAQLAYALGKDGVRVATGGGPGAMEAANLGAYLSAYDDGALADALERLAQVPSFGPSVGNWARAAAGVVREYPDGAPNLGVPTWFYGHEPPNLFATHIAKYFANPIREAILLEKCTGGIIFLQGAAGTVQEIFQDACENYYSAVGKVRPMVLVGREYWTNTVPAWPLLKSLGKERPMGESVHLTDSAAEAVKLLRDPTNSAGLRP